jgi:hypothetical protein
LNNRQKKVLVYAAFGAVMLAGFQNCSPVAFQQSTVSSYGSPANPGTTTTTIQAIQPALAVRGTNCMACHGYSNSNVITDFGYGSPNFMAVKSGGSSSAPTFFNSNNRTAFNNSGDGNNDGGWVNNEDGAGWSNFVVNGSVVVPKISFSAAQAATYFGVNNSTDLATILGTPGIVGSGAPSMIAGVTPGTVPVIPGVTGEAVIPVSQITITYPSQSEILGLAPSLSGVNVGTALYNVPNLSPSSESGLAATTTSSGSYVTNTGPVSCSGDVVVKGPLFLNNLVLQSNSAGCRLYVSQTVFIQGPISVSGSGANLQITSPFAIVMGFSANRMGALQGATATSGFGKLRQNGSTAVSTPGGPWPRFPTDEDVEYNPSGANINGLPSSNFFDSIVADALSIGPVLLDAGDPSYVSTLQSANIVTEPNTSDNAQDGGPRAKFNYNAVLLNAPHVHSRYFGNLTGVIIADVAFLARNPTAGVFDEMFVYDTTFNQVPVIFPALTTSILSVTP